MKKLIVTVLAAALTLTACGGGSESASSTLRVGTLSDAPPNIYLKDGNYTGFDNELLKAIAAKQNLKLEFAATDFSALLGQVASGRFDIASSAIAQTDERKKTVDFSAAYDFETMSIQAKQGTPVTDEKGLAGKRVAVIQATVGDHWLTSTVPAAQAVRFPDYAAALTALKTGAVDAYILDQSIAEKNVTDNPDAKLVVVKSFVTDVPHGFAVKKGNADLLKKVDDGLKQVISDGTWLKLHQQFLPTAPVPAGFQG
ncbi:ABC transporter substrate-binding protein [Amycolatopsis sp. SID8362]|uniref:ABC transporter substrate-binding protein n=1 Tax=Amycolatopsis sp. SID8362 TaxID=2690346 RepID=UPI00136D675D|nr:ABC transporter substrate-binding protein [Amycolatopsis sp. SID8362]NBH02470.1 transporter substrate-binding domain-containing protein [Amycolatopsis sp. SID8362]NED39174.1 amino acid ABC transporter substrate-binding protein [Amycolatopsis sp. SID8362]